MFLSDRTMRLLVESGLAPERLVEILQSLRADEEAARPMQSQAARRQAAYRQRRKASPSITERNAVTLGDENHNEASPAPPPPAFPPEPPQPPTPTRECISTREEREREEAGFAKFWQAYPRKTAKADARKAFAKAWRKLPPFDEELILAGGLERAKAAWTDAQFIPHAATWLNGERWQDEATIIPMKPPHERPHHDPRQAARADRLGRSLAGLMAAVDEREPAMGRGGADAGGRS
jgi:hypothetical protein